MGSAPGNTLARAWQCGLGPPVWAGPATASNQSQALQAPRALCTLIGAFACKMGGRAGGDARGLLRESEANKNK